jgi:hypothetical protein
MLKFPSGDDFDLDAIWQCHRASASHAEPTDRDRFYRGSYPFILAHFRQCEFDGSKADCGRFWQALILAYSWMGRGILTNFQDPLQRYRDQCQRLGQARATGKISLHDFEAIVGLCNGSVIATSKFLHFLNPTSFAIWDSRVCAAIFDGKAHHYQLKQVANYLVYLDWINSLAWSDITKGQVCEHLNIDVDIGALRAKEYVLFMAGQKQAPIDA